MSFIELPPRLPIRFIPEHAELRKSQIEPMDLTGLNKSQEALSGGHADAGTDWTKTEEVSMVPEGVVPQFRAPGDRNIGNVMFRREPDGTLDMENAKNLVVDMVHKVKDKSPLTSLEEIVLSVLFPTLFSFIDARLAGPMAAIHLRLAPWETIMVQERVAAHLKSEMSYNAGLGGFPAEHPRQ